MELILSGPKGTARAQLEAPITECGVKAAMAIVWQIYDSMPEPIGQPPQDWEAVHDNGELLALRGPIYDFWESIDG